MTGTSDWQCFLIPIELFRTFAHLPIHESFRSRLKHLVVPDGFNQVEVVRREIKRHDVCAVSWHRSGALPDQATLDTLRDWSPMSAHQLERLKDLTNQTTCRFVWIDWVCIPQLSGDLMRFINSSHDIYSAAREVLFIPRINKLPRRGWPALSPSDTDAAAAFVKASAKARLSSRAFSPAFHEVLGHQKQIGQVENILAAVDWKSEPFERQLDSGLQTVRRMLNGDELLYPMFEYYGRAWTLAKRLAIFEPTKDNPVLLGDMHLAGDALLFSMAGFWREGPAPEPGGYSDRDRLRIDRSHLARQVYSRGYDELQPGIQALWEDANRISQMVSTFRALVGSVAALAVISVEWLLHNKAGARDPLGRLAADLLGECVAYAALVVATAKLPEQANLEWFRKYMYFQAGRVYKSTLERDLILAVYRSFGLQGRQTADQAIEASLREAFGTDAVAAKLTGNSEFSGTGDRPELAQICSEALRHDQLNAHLWSRGTGEHGLAASDFVPMFPSARQPAPMALSAWFDWLEKSGIVVAWWWSQPDQTVPFEPGEFIDVEQLFCEDVTRLAGLSLDDVFRSGATIVYKIRRLSDRKWQLVQVSLLRYDGRCGESYRAHSIFDLIRRSDILNDSVTSCEKVEKANRRCLETLHNALHQHWDQCIFSEEVVMGS